MIYLLATDHEPRRFPVGTVVVREAVANRHRRALVTRHAMAADGVFGAVCGARPLRERCPMSGPGGSSACHRDGLPQAVGAARAASLGLREDHLELGISPPWRWAPPSFFRPADPHAAAAQLRPANTNGSTG
jgi:hypothetical protein